MVQHLLASPLGWLVGKLLGEARFRKTFSSIFGAATQPSDEELKACWQLVAHNQGQAIMHKLIRYMQERKNHRDRWVGALQNTTVPLRLIDGGADPISGAHMVETYCEIVPRPDVVLLSDIGHYPQLEAAERVIQGLLL
jgi:pimeloyl-ACP methyl ester carboxylesterase